MIGKIIKGRSFKGCVSYVLGSKDAELLAGEGVFLNDTNSIITGFYMQSLMNPNLSKCVGHISLAFSPDDSPRLTDRFMLQSAKEYMKAMEIKNTQYIIVRHNNTAHPHLHIVFNRVDNDGKTVSDKNDRYRNEKVCKQLKDSYNLTYGKGKEKVNVRKLKGAEQIKYEIYHAIKNTLSKVRNREQFEHALNRQRISIEYKRKGQTDEIQGISFKKGEYSFKGSEIDRNFSYSKLDAVLNVNRQTQQIHIQSQPKESAASGFGDLVSEVSNLFDIQLSGSDYDPDEAELMRQQKIKRKEKRKGIRM